MSRNTPPTSAVLLPLLVLLSLTFGSCVVTEFVGAYFNTYYNAQKLFAEAEDDVWSTQDTRSSGRNLLLPLNASTAAKQKLTSVIEKCSKLLQYHPESKLVDDALLMVGKAYFYQADFPAAERKFKELVDTYPSSGLVLTAKMYEAYSRYKGNNIEGALTLGKEVENAAREAGDDGVEAYASLLLGQIEQDRKSYAQAREAYENAGEKAGNADLRATAYLTAAEMYVRSGDSLHALGAYAQAEGVARNYVHRFRALLGQARMLAKVGRPEEAMDLLQRLRRNANYKEFWGDVDLQIGDVYQSMEAFDSAIDQYTYVDTAYARSEAAANADYQLGQIYEHHYLQYDSARVMYAKGRGASPQWTIAPVILRRSDLLNRYQIARFAIHLNDSLRTAWKTRKDTSSPGPGFPLGADTSSGGGQPPSAHGAPPDSARPGQPAPLPLPWLSQRPPDAPAQPSTEGRRGTPRTADSLRAAMNTGSTDSVLQAMQRAAARPVPIDTVLVRLENALNEFATLWYTGFGNTDSAFSWYRRLLEEFPGGRHTARALFTMAQMYAGLDSAANKERVDSLYHVIVERYGATEFASEARARLGLPPVAAAIDSAETAYHSAERLLLSGSYAEAVDAMRGLALVYPRSPFALRAEYAAGWLYEQKLGMPDSAIALYRRLAVRYPGSTYAAIVKPKLEAVEQKNAAPPAPPAQPDAKGQGPGAKLQTAPNDSAAGPILRARNLRRRQLEDSLDVLPGRTARPDTTGAAAPGRRPAGGEGAGKPDTTGQGKPVPPGPGGSASEGAARGGLPSPAKAPSPGAATDGKSWPGRRDSLLPPALRDTLAPAPPAGADTLGPRNRPASDTTGTE